MKLYERFWDRGFHSSIATSFGIDFDAYESVVLSRLRGAGCRNNMVVSDGRMITHAIEGASALPRLAGSQYTLSGFSPAAGVFHPKLLLQFGRKSGRLIVGSANLTSSGIAGNLELVDNISFDGDETGEAQLIAQAWGYLSGFLKRPGQGVADQMRWALARTPWLVDVPVEPGNLVALADGTSAAFLATSAARGIGERFVDLIDEPVKRLTVLSPYWDPTLAALRQLVAWLGPAETSVLVDPATREFPGNAAETIPSLTLFDRSGFHDGRFIHAKAIIAETEDADHILFGSANCTTAALGGAGIVGRNEEASLYRRLPPGTLLEALGLLGVLSLENVIQPSALEQPEFAEEIPLGELRQLNAGQFELLSDTLIWHPAAAIEDPKSCRPIPLNENASPLDCQLQFLAEREGPVHYRLSSSEQLPTFVSVEFPDGARSAPAIVTWIEQLRENIREPHRSGTQRKLDDLEDDTEASLALLYVLGELEALDDEEATVSATISLPRGKMQEDEATTTNYRTMPYEDFIAGRRPKQPGWAVQYSSLADSNVSIIRGILNRIVDIRDGVHQLRDSVSSDEIMQQFDLGDETADPEAAINSGKNFGFAPQEKQETDEGKALRRAARRRATSDELVQAVELFRGRIKEKESKDISINKFDLLRLRLLLMILCAASSPRSKAETADEENSSLFRVLPVEGDLHSWPRLLGQLMFTFFGGPQPAVKSLHLVNEHDQVPDDFTECWATCYWCLQASLHAPMSSVQRKLLHGYLTDVATNAYVMTLPSKEELLSEQVMKVMASMSESYGAQLGLDLDAIRTGHRRLVASLFGAASDQESAPLSERP